MKQLEIHEIFPSFYPQSPSKIDDVYSPEQYPELFKSLNLLDTGKQKEIPKGILPKNPLTTIPSILHYVWLGKNSIPEESRKNISFFCDQIKQHLQGICVIWTDQTKMDEEVESWLKSNGVFLVQVQAVFGNPSAMETFYHFNAALTKIPANYGEASDLLRYEILYRFGGYYLDHDIPENLDFIDLIEKGVNPPHKFVGARIQDNPRNDIIGSVPRAPFFKKLKETILDNYKNKNWKKHIEYSKFQRPQRPYLIDSTTFLTGPEIFGIAVAQFFDDLKIPYYRDFLFFNDHNSIDLTFITRNQEDSAAKWVHRRVTDDSSRHDDEEISQASIEHDLLLQLDKDEEILDLLKYESRFKDISIIPMLESMIRSYPAYFSKVTRIFTKHPKDYIHLLELMEKIYESEKLWNELAALKVACVTENIGMVELLISKINPFTSRYTHVGEYDCSYPSPLTIAIERGNDEIVEKIIHFDPAAAKQSLLSKRDHLIYAGPYYTATYALSAYEIPSEKIRALEERKKNDPLFATFNPDEHDRKIRKYQKIKERLENILHDLSKSDPLLP